MKRIVRKPAVLVGFVLLISPLWLAFVLALLPGFQPNMGMLLGFSLPFWGLASLVGWVVFFAACRAAGSWWVAGLGTLAALMLNVFALLGLHKVENIKMRSQFAKHKQLLASVGDKLLANSISLEEAKRIVATHNLDFTPKLVSREKNCTYVFFHAFGALDSQVGYYYTPLVNSEKVCRQMRYATKTEQKWCFGAL